MGFRVVSHKDFPEDEKYLITAVGIAGGLERFIRVTITFMAMVGGCPVTVTRFYSPEDYKKYIMNSISIEKELSRAEIKAAIDAGIELL